MSEWPAGKFPGLDFPDREKWLARRATPRKLRREVVVYSAENRKPLVLGINRLKRQLDAQPIGGRRQLIKARHAYYTHESAS
jgi:hypothetical protein